MIGTVKWYRREQGFGFVAAGGRDYFVHNEDVQPRGAVLAEGLTVEFEPGIGPRGLRALAVRIIPDMTGRVPTSEERGRDGNAS